MLQSESEQGQKGSGTLSMKFKQFGADDKDIIVIEATPLQKAELAKFLLASLNTDQIELSNWAALDPDDILHIHEKVIMQAHGNDLILNSTDVARLGKLSSTWINYKFNNAPPNTEFPVSRRVAENIESIFHDVYPEV